MTQPTTYICVRETVEWADEAAFRAQLVPEYAATVNLWDATFNMPYHLFRHRLREIARASIAEVRGAQQACWEDVPEGGLVLPVDDDDWFAPGAAEAAQAGLVPERELYHWEAVFLEVPIDLGHLLYLWKRRILRTPPKWICSTNNYAVIKTPEAEPLFRSHVKASRWVHQNPRKVGVIAGQWSVMNRTVSSRTTLGIVRPESLKNIAQTDLLRKYAKYRDLYRRAPAAGLEWCRPYLAMMDGLMRELLPAGGGSA